MDLGTIIGIAAGFVIVVLGILLGGSPMIFFNWPSLCITVGGAVGATLMHFPLPKILAVLRVVRKAFSHQSTDYINVYRQMMELGLKARRDGILAVESDLERFHDEFIKKGFQMAVDGNSSDVIRHVLDEDVAAMQRRHLTGQSIFKAMAAYAPAFGMIGTLIGLIQMLKNMSDPASIGSGMATALITTFYGAIIANLVCLPIAGKLEQRSDEEVAMKGMMMEGILAIQEGNSPRMIKDKLRSYMPPAVRQQVDWR
ncbi:MAG: motility protein A [Lentisphaerae bacterium]|nr:motility protein A [Lentisphaerota bacterium]